MCTRTRKLYSMIKPTFLHLIIDYIRILSNAVVRKLPACKCTLLFFRYMRVQCCAMLTLYRLVPTLPLSRVNRRSKHCCIVICNWCVDVLGLLGCSIKVMYCDRWLWTKYLPYTLPEPVLWAWIKLCNVWMSSSFVYANISHVVQVCMGLLSFCNVNVK